MTLIVFQPHQRRQFVCPATIPGINRVDQINILGVTVSNTLSLNHHVTAVVEKCSRSLYALKTIQAHGLAGNALLDIARATLVAQLLYNMQALPGGVP